MTTRKTWTSLERTQLVQMVSQKKSDEQIAEILGRGKSSVTSKRIEIFGATKKYRKRRKSLAPRVPKAPKLAIGGGDLEITQRTLKALGYKLALVKIIKE
jgi:hypothetical protein